MQTLQLYTEWYQYFTITRISFVELYNAIIMPTSPGVLSRAHILLQRAPNLARQQPTTKSRNTKKKPPTRLSTYEQFGVVVGALAE